MPLLTPEEIESFTPDLTPQARTAMIADAEAIAAHYAPCLRVEPLAPHIAAVAKAVILSALKYDVQVQAQGLLATQHEQTGPFGVTNFPHHRSGTLFSPTQVDLLRSLCSSSVPGAYSVPLDTPDTLPGW